MQAFTDKHELFDGAENHALLMFKQFGWQCAVMSDDDDDKLLRRDVFAVLGDRRPNCWLESAGLSKQERLKLIKPVRFKKTRTKYYTGSHLTTTEETTYVSVDGGEWIRLDQYDGYPGHYGPVFVFTNRSKEMVWRWAYNGLTKDVEHLERGLAFLGTPEAATYFNCDHGSVCDVCSGTRT